MSVILCGMRRAFALCHPAPSSTRRAPIPWRSWPRPTVSPNTGKRPLLTNPCFILEPDFQGLATCGLRQRRLYLGHGVGLWMLRVHGQPPKAERGELIAHCAFVPIDLKAHFDFPLQINPPPAYDETPSHPSVAAPPCEAHLRSSQYG